jgi:hypothetical protein
MSKFNRDPFPPVLRVTRTALRHALELEFLNHPWRFLLHLAGRFAKGWALTQLFGLFLLGGILLGVLLLNPAAFAVQVRTVSQVSQLAGLFSHAMAALFHCFGVLIGLWVMVLGTLNEGTIRARQLSEQRGVDYEE